MKGYDVERKVAAWKMNVWTLKLCESESNVEVGVPHTAYTNTNQEFVSENK